MYKTPLQESEHISPVLHEVYWLPISYSIQVKLLLITFKVLHGSGPPTKLIYSTHTLTREPYGLLKI